MSQITLHFQGKPSFDYGVIADKALTGLDTDPYHAPVYRKILSFAKSHYPQYKLMAVEVCTGRDCHVITVGG